MLMITDRKPAVVLGGVVLLALVAFAGFRSAGAAFGGSVSTADTVYIASGANFPDALGAGGAAGAIAAPIILLPPNPPIPLSSATELQRLNPKTLLILGGTAAISEAVESELRALLPGASITRIAGANRYETNAMLSAMTYPVGDASPAAVIRTVLGPQGCPLGEYRLVVETVSGEPISFQPSPCFPIRQTEFNPIWHGAAYLPSGSIHQMAGLYWKSPYPQGPYRQIGGEYWRLSCRFDVATRGSVLNEGSLDDSGNVIAPVRLSCAVDTHMDTSPDAIAALEAALASGHLRSGPFEFFSDPTG